MLIEISCPRFRTKRIRFHKGLNVVVGDPGGANSIGKSTLLMIVDFVFGGDSLLEHNYDTITELGHHVYSFALRFGKKTLYFSRATSEPNQVSVCNSDYEPASTLKLSEYTELLASKYGLKSHGISFRSAVGVYSRVWGKQNLTIDRPLHPVPNSAASQAIDTLIRLFGRFTPIAGLTASLAKNEKVKKAIDSAFRENLITRITAAQFKQNKTGAASLQKALREIRDHLSAYSISVSQITDEKTLLLKQRKDQFLRRKFVIEEKLARIKQNLPGRSGIHPAHLEKLTEFFPSVNRERLAQISNFHKGLTRILSTELRSAQKSLTIELEDTTQMLKRVDAELESSLKPIKNPGVIIDKVLELSSNLNRMKMENDYHSKQSNVAIEIQQLRESLQEQKQAISHAISNRINRILDNLTSQVYADNRRSPTITISDSNYSFEIFEDTGTGKAYANLLIFDLAVLTLTRLPFLIHDSLLFKNVENKTVANLLAQYARHNRQIFIALDEIPKFGEPAEALVAQRLVVALDNTNVLFDKDWRKTL